MDQTIVSYIPIKLFDDALYFALYLGEQSCDKHKFGMKSKKQC